MIMTSCSRASRGLRSTNCLVFIAANSSSASHTAKGCEFAASSSYNNGKEDSLPIRSVVRAKGSLMKERNASGDSGPELVVNLSGFHSSKDLGKNKNGWIFGGIFGRKNGGIGLSGFLDAGSIRFQSSGWSPVGRRMYSTQETMDTFRFEDVLIRRCTADQLQQKPDWNNLTFGHHFSDHMLEIPWSTKDGWKRPVISPFHDLQLHPAAKVLHYAIELFEGIKAYRGVDNRIRIFRPDMNMIRMNRTALRACLPSFDGEELIKCLEELIRIDQEWVPYSTTNSLYIRPTFIGTDPHIGIGQSNSALLFVFLSPVGAYFPTGLKPIKLLAEPKFVRAFPGGTGDAKLGCNYAPTILIGKKAQEEGCQQVLWLFGEDEEITEVGTMNIFVLWKNENGEKELVTPPLTEGLILPGVTRDSILEITREWNEFKVSEKRFTMKQLRKALSEGRVLEMFGAGTACIVSPVDRILYRDEDMREELLIPTMMQKECLMQRLFDTLNDIQYGREARPGWTRLVT